MSDTAIQEQQPAPDFTLPAVGSDDVVNNGQVHLADLKGKTVVLYFYPKDDTPGCTKEACNFRDANHLARFWSSDLGAQFKKQAEDQVKIRILGPTFFGTRQVGLKPLAFPIHLSSGSFKSAA